MIKFRLKPGDIQRLEAKVRRDINNIIANPQTMNEIGADTVERIKYQARVGKPINSDGTFPELKDSTVKNRKRLAEFNETHEVFAARRSNLTIIGAFLNALTYKIKGGSNLEIFFEGRHPQYKGPNGPVGKSVENSQLATWLKEKGFRVFDSSISDNATIIKRISSIVRRNLRRGLGG